MDLVSRLSAVFVKSGQFQLPESPRKKVRKGLIYSLKARRKLLDELNGIEPRACPFQFHWKQRPLKTAKHRG